MTAEVKYWLMGYVWGVATTVAVVSLVAVFR